MPKITSILREIAELSKTVSGMEWVSGNDVPHGVEAIRAKHNKQLKHIKHRLSDISKENSCCGGTCSALKSVEDPEEVLP